MLLMLGIPVPPYNIRTTEALYYSGDGPDPKPYLITSNTPPNCMRKATKGVTHATSQMRSIIEWQPDSTGGSCIINCASAT
jgi:hypothetical protein